MPLPAFARTKKKLSLLIAAAALLLLLLVPVRPALHFVNELHDHSHDLAIQQSLVIAAKKADAEFALVQLRELPPGVTAKAHAVALFERLRIGASHRGRGVLILTSAKEKAIKIEVSYPLEGVLPDVVCHGLEEAAATYFLRESSQDFFSELVITLSNAIQDGKTPREDLTSTWSAEHLSGGAGALGNIPAHSPAELLEAIRKIPLRDRALFAPSEDANETLQLYLKSLRLGFGEPQLPLLTPGSQVFRVVVPRSHAQIQRISDDYEKAGLRELIRKDEFALAVFARASSTLPIVLRRGTDHLWRVDEVKTWTYFHRFEDAREFYLLTDDNPFRPDLIRENWPTAECTIYKKRFTLPQTDFGHAPAAGTTLADWYLFETGWLERAKAIYQTDASIESRWKLFHVLLNLSEAEKALDVLTSIDNEAYARGEYHDRELHEWAYQYRMAYLDGQMEFADRLGRRLWLYAQSWALALRKHWRDVWYDRTPQRCLAS